MAMSDLYGIGDIEVWNGRVLEEVVTFDDLQELEAERDALSAKLFEINWALQNVKADETFDSLFSSLNEILESGVKK